MKFIKMQNLILAKRLKLANHNAILLDEKGII